MRLVSTEPKKIYIGTTEAKKVYLWDTLVRPIIPYLCFTANTANSTVKLQKNWSPTSVTLETSTDGRNWSTYTIGNTITLSNVWNKVYWRNTSETNTWFSMGTSNNYQFVMSWSIAWSGDVNYLLNKNSATSLSDYCFTYLFKWCTALTTPPELPTTALARYCYLYMFYWCTNLTTVPALPATTLAIYCYNGMFYNCSSLETLPNLPATTLNNFCYNSMFVWCSKIKISNTQTWEYQTPYRIPTTWTWTTATNALTIMFTSTWWTFTWTPTINTTYYTSNTVV